MWELQAVPPEAEAESYSCTQWNVASLSPNDRQTQAIGVVSDGDLVGELHVCHGLNDSRQDSRSSSAIASTLIDVNYARQLPLRGSTGLDSVIILIQLFISLMIAV